MEEIGDEKADNHESVTCQHCEPLHKVRDVL